MWCVSCITVGACWLALAGPVDPSETGGSPRSLYINGYIYIFNDT